MVKQLIISTSHTILCEIIKHRHDVGFQVSSFNSSSKFSQVGSSRSPNHRHIILAQLPIYGPQFSFQCLWCTRVSNMKQAAWRNSGSEPLTRSQPLHIWYHNKTSKLISAMNHNQLMVYNKITSMILNSVINHRSRKTTVSSNSNML